MEDPGSDSEYSDSSGSVSTTSSSSSGDTVDDTSELARIGKHTLKLPKGLCENALIFQEFFSMETWKSLPDNFQAYLKNKFLPHFSEKNEEEQETTLQLLFKNEISRFGLSPLMDFQKHLEEGSYRPDVLKLRESIKRCRRREQRFQECERISQLAKTLMISRERLLRSAYDAPPGAVLKVDRIVNSAPKMTNTGAALRARKRFYEEISSVAQQLGLSDLSEDEFPDSEIVSRTKSTPIQQVSPTNETKIFGTMCRRNCTNSFSNPPGPLVMLNDNTIKQVLLAHKRRKLEEPDRPEFDTSDIRLRDVHARTQLLIGYRKPGPGRPLGRKSHKNKQDHPDGASASQSSETTVNSFGNQQTAIEKFGMSLLEQQTMSNDNTNSDTDDDIPVNVDSLTPPQATIAFEEVGRKRPVSQVLSSKGCKKMLLNVNGTAVPENVAKSMDIKEEPGTNSLPTSHYHPKMKPATLSDLEGIDMMHLPVDLDDSAHIDLLTEIKSESSEGLGPELMQETHACFLSLIRDIFCSTPNHRMKLDDLKIKIYNWLLNPITALNDWYCLADNWLALIPSAIHFLAGEFVDQPEDFVPYVEFKTQINIYQWIGAGRDSDQHLMQLCNYWLARRNEMGSKPMQKFDLGPPKSSVEFDESLLNERPISPPPPRFPTNWTVQPATSEEIDKFRVQERQRFENPHKAFTYRMHGYESVVGPVKGVYTQILALTKARGHNMLTADRPNFVTILTLVRDATARLPNGEGTRADICELLKSSQYINPQAQDNILQTIVSGALDRMHTEHDPCVRYDAKRKIWIYLHRNRSEEEFERLHQQLQGVGKHKKIPNRKITKQKPGKVMQGIEGSSIQPVVVVSSSPNASSLTKPVTTIASGQGTQVVHTSNTNTTVNPPLLKVTPQNALGKQDHLLLQNQTLTSSIEKVETVEIVENPSEPPSAIQKSHINLQSSAIENRIHKIITKKPVASPSVSPANTTPIKVSTPAGIQTVHVSCAIPISSVSPDHSKSSVSLSTNQPPVGQTTTINQNQSSQGQIIVGGKKITKPILINQGQTTSLVSQVGTSGQGYIIPININNSEQMKSIPAMSSAILTTSNLSPKMVKSSQPPSLASPINRPTTLIQQGGKNIVRVATTTAQAGKSLISPHVAATNISLQQQKLLTNVGASNLALQQKLNSSPNVVSNIRPQLQKATGVSLINTTTVKTHPALTPMQQKQILQNIIQQQQKQRGNTVNMSHNTVVIPSGTITGQQNSGIQTKNVIIPQQQGNIQQIQKIVSVSSTGLTTVSVGGTAQNTTNTATNTANLISNPQSGANLINSQIIQIQGTGPKVQTLNAANLTPQQQQNLLQSIKQQQLKMQQGHGGSPQQSLIIKQQPIFQQIQKSQTSSLPTTISVSVGTGSPKTVTSLMGTNVTNLIATPSTIAGSSVLQHQPQNIVKHQTLVQQSSAGKQINVNSQPQTITRVIKSGASIIQPQIISSVAGVRTTTGNPVMAKVLANSSGQIISLESLLQKQAVTPGTTLRVASAKPSQTNLIQLAGTPGSQITQYAVVSQGRNLISVGTPQRMITTQAGTNAIVTSLGNAIGKLNEQKNSATAVNVQSQVTNQPKVITANQIQPITAQQLVNAKVLGKAGAAGIRMVNASNLNIAHIRGKPVIIASKPANVSTQQTGQNVILQNPGSGTNLVIGGQTLKVQGNVMSPTNVQVLNQPTSSQPQTVVLGNQILKVQQATSLKQQTAATNILGVSMGNSNNTGTSHLTSIANSNAGTVVVNSISQTAPKTVVLGSTGQTIRVQSPAQVQVQTASSASQNQQMLLGTPIKSTAVAKGANSGQQRVVLAVQGGGQILLPPGFQGGAINLKSLQGLKVVSIAQQQNKGQSDERPMFAQLFTAQQAPRPPNPGGE